MTKDERDVIRTNTPNRVIYILVTCIITLIIATGISIGYSAQAVHSARIANDAAIVRAQQVNLHNLQQICGIIVILDNAYQSPATPPTTALGRKLASALAAYRLFLGCDSLK
jgi:hypothetical protein